MALPSKNEVMNLDFSLDGQPFVHVAAHDDIDSLDLDWTLDGQPFLAGPSESADADEAACVVVAAPAGYVRATLSAGMYGAAGIGVGASAAATLAPSGILGGAVGVGSWLATAGGHGACVSGGAVATGGVASELAQDGVVGTDVGVGAGAAASLSVGATLGSAIAVDTVLAAELVIVPAWADRFETRSPRGLFRVRADAPFEARSPRGRFIIRRIRMSHKGPDIEVDYGYAYPFRVLRADSDIPAFTGQTITFRIGVPGPVDGSLPTPLVEVEATPLSDDEAIGTTSDADMEIDPSKVYAYHFHMAGFGIIERGRCTIALAVGST